MDNEKQQAEHLGSSDCSSGIVAKLRYLSAVLGEDGEPNAVMAEAARMLEFLFDQMQMHSLKMNGQHSYRFRSGWPMTHCVGPNAEEAIRAALREVDEQTGRIE